jgi:hypothetical protein
VCSLSARSSFPSSGLSPFDEAVSVRMRCVLRLPAIDAGRRRNSAEDARDVVAEGDAGEEERADSTESSWAEPAVSASEREDIGEAGDDVEGPSDVTEGASTGTS